MDLIKKIDHNNLGNNIFLKEDKQCSLILSLLNIERWNWVKKGPKKISLSQYKLAWQICNPSNQG
jgi:hypothetical protein